MNLVQHYMLRVALEEPSEFQVSLSLSRFTYVTLSKDSTCHASNLTLVGRDLHLQAPSGYPVHTPLTTRASSSTSTRTSTLTLVSANIILEMLHDRLTKMNVHSAWSDTLRHDFSCTSKYCVANDRNMEHGSSTDDCAIRACRYCDSYVLKRTSSDAMIFSVNPVLTLKNMYFRICNWTNASRFCS